MPQTPPETAARPRPPQYDPAPHGPHSAADQALQQSLDNPYLPQGDYCHFPEQSIPALSGPGRKQAVTVHPASPLPPCTPPRRLPGKWYVCSSAHGTEASLQEQSS